MENTNKKTIVSLVIGIVSLVVVIVGATYAYWSAKGIVNFNTATITYETASKTLLTLNGTTGLLTLGTITSNDMSVYDREKIYYASATGKKVTPTEETIGEVITPVGDLNTYRCNFTLALTHSGSADLIDRFLSETNGEPDYENRSAGQIILTVNGVEYDLDDGFPSTINGTFEASDGNSGQINVGMKFINLPNVNQIYLKNTNGAINITVTDFSCELKEWETVYLAPRFYTGEESTAPRNYGTSLPLTPVSDYHDISYTYLYDNDNSHYAFMIMHSALFDTLSECEAALNNPNYSFYEDILYTCVLVDGEHYRIKDETQNIYYSNLRTHFESCEEAIDIIINDSNFYYYAQREVTSSSVEYNFSSNLSCVTYYPDIFVKETTMPIVALQDEWAIEYYYKRYGQETIEQYQSLESCIQGGTGDSNTTTYYYSYNREPCIKSQSGDYIRKDLVTNYDISKTGSTGNAEDVSKIKLFNTESDCNDFIDDYIDDTDYISPTCVLVREEGKAYQVTNSELCIYEDSNNASLKCFNVEDESFLENEESLVEELEDMGYTCLYGDHHVCQDDRYRIDFIKDDYNGWYIKSLSIGSFYDPTLNSGNFIGYNEYYDWRVYIYLR